jgi:protein O-GlcNAc transferase
MARNQLYSGARRPAADFLATLGQAITAHQAGNLAQAEALYNVVLSKDDRHFDALHMLGVLAGQRGDFPKADRLIRLALDSDPRSFAAHSNHARVLLELKQYKQALGAAEQALTLDSTYVNAHLFRGCALLLLGKFEPALQSFDRALALAPDFVLALFNRGEVLFELKRYQEALAAYHKALTAQPDYADALKGVGNVFYALQHFDRALAAYDKALAIRPDFPEAWLGRGNVLYQLGCAACDQAPAPKPDFAGAWPARGNFSSGQAHFHQALAAYDKALALKPDLKYAQGSRLRAKMQVCDWSSLDEECSRLISAVRNGTHASDPFTLLATPSSPDDQLKCARLFVADRVCRDDEPLRPGRRPSRDRIRIAYLSADFRQHVIATVVAELLELHDRSRFEILGVSFGSDDRSELRGRLSNAFDRFHDVRNNTDREVAELLRDREIDIAVDLMGHTEHSRPGVFVNRPAPVQVNYLGFPGTMGAGFIDYILVDRFVLPFDQQPFFAEKIVHLPDSYQPTDSRREVSPHVPRRSEIGLPEDQFVFCCFNNSYKFSPRIFDIWMRLLKSIEGSVLWLTVADDPTRQNLRREAEGRGIAAGRLVLTDRVGHADYLARQVLADLFLDTLPYNAHGTGSNALAAGLPVLTCRGTTFAGRVGTSLLQAVGLPELATDGLEEYEALARKLATDPELFRSVRGKLQANRATCALFDTDRLRRHIEAAYQTMWERYRRGEPPASFSVAPNGNAIGAPAEHL